MSMHLADRKSKGERERKGGRVCRGEREREIRKREKDRRERMKRSPDLSCMERVTPLSVVGPISVPFVYTGPEGRERHTYRDMGMGLCICARMRVEVVGVCVRMCEAFGTRT